jgi:hypothetical protein
MTITLTFSEEEQEEAMTALNGTKWMLAMWELDQWLRSEAKYSEKRTEKEIDLIYEIRERIQQELNENGLHFDQ